MQNSEYFSQLMLQSGNTITDYILNCDIAVLKNRGKKEYRQIKRTIKTLNKDVIIQNGTGAKKLDSLLGLIPINHINYLLASVLCCFAIYYYFKLLVGNSDSNIIMNVFFGIILQAIPFLLVGTMLSSAIQVFVPTQFIEKHFPKNIFLGVLFGAFAGFFLPVCDCVSVPVFRSLVKKGIPLPSAITFMMATPVINPVVIMSTWYAFGGSLKIVLLRVLLGIICSIIIGLSFFRHKYNIYKEDAVYVASCSCNSATVSNTKNKFVQFIEHTKSDFFSVSKYLIIGAFASSVIQTVFKNISVSGKSAGLLLATLFMMFLAFVLSLCSSSDAVVARSFSSQFPVGAIMGFLVYGPMMDIKNLFMLSGMFPKKFVVRLFVTTTLVCCIVVYAVFVTGLGGLLF